MTGKPVATRSAPPFPFPAAHRPRPSPRGPLPRATRPGVAALHSIVPSPRERVAEAARRQGGQGHATA
eukprot:1292675-Lingulodinium_polyedra.AAC.1